MNFKIKCHIYPYTVHVFYEQKVEDAQKEYEKYYKTLVDEHFTGFQALTLFPLKGSIHANTIAILLGDKHILSCVHHEVIHAATHILDKLGLEISYQNDESITYLSTYLFEKILKKLKLNIHQD